MHGGVGKAEDDRVGDRGGDVVDQVQRRQGGGHDDQGPGEDEPGRGPIHESAQYRGGDDGDDRGNRKDARRDVGVEPPELKDGDLVEEEPGHEQGDEGESERDHPECGRAKRLASASGR